MTGPSPCATCSSRCCIDYVVTVTGYDAWRIATESGLGFESFLVYFALSDQTKPGFVLKPRGTRYDIALDKVGDFRKGNPCIFWMDFMNGRGRCGIYRIRPHVCQTYPAYLSHGTVLLRDDVYCPEGAWHLVAMDLPEFRGRLERFQVEQEIYAYLVDRWNRHVDLSGAQYSVRSYYAYLSEAYSEMERSRASLSPQALRAAVERWAADCEAGSSPLLANVPLHEPYERWNASIDSLRLAIERNIVADGSVAAEA